jgi:hypothetical protein
MSVSLAPNSPITPEADRVLVVDDHRSARESMKPTSV